MDRSCVMLQLLQSLAFDLTNTFASHLEDTTGFFQRVAVTIAQAVTQFHDFTFTIRQALQHVIDLVSQHLLGSRFRRALFV